MSKSSRIIRLEAVKERTGLSRSTIYAKIANNEFPKPVKITGKAVGWVETEIDQHNANKIAERDGATH